MKCLHVWNFFKSDVAEVLTLSIKGMQVNLDSLKQFPYNHYCPKDRVQFYGKMVTKLFIGLVWYKVLRGWVTEKKCWSNSS